MTFLPAFLRLRVQRWPTLWLPLFLLWPLVLVMFVVLCAVVFALDQRSTPRHSSIHGRRCAAAASIHGRRSVFACLVGVWRLLCATRGTSVDVDVANSRLCISLY
jgi:hypothetical protein